MSKLITLRIPEGLDSVSLPDIDLNLFTSRSWLKVLQKTYHLNLFVKYLEIDGRIENYIVYSVVKNFLEWKICICSYCDYFDCHVKSADYWQLFFDELRKEYPAYRIAIRNLRDEHALKFEKFEVLSQEWHHQLDLNGSVDDIWKNMYSSFKAACNQSAKILEVRKCTKEALPDFYRLHLKLRKNKYRLFPQPYRFFDIIWDEFIANDQGVMLGAYDKAGELVGANVFLICHDTLYYKFNTSKITELKTRPNNLLMWEGIKFAKERNLKFLDLGSSGYNQKGLVWFKNHISKDKLQSPINHIGYAPPEYKFSEKKILRTYTDLLTHAWVPDSGVAFGCNFIYPFLA